MVKENMVTWGDWPSDASKTWSLSLDVQDVHHPSVKTTRFPYPFYQHSPSHQISVASRSFPNFWYHCSHGTTANIGWSLLKAPQTSDFQHRMVPLSRKSVPMDSDASWEDFRDDFIILEQQLKLEGRPTAWLFSYIFRALFVKGFLG